MKDYIVAETESDRVRLVGHLMRSDHGFTGFQDSGESVFVVDSSVTGELASMGIRVKAWREDSRF